MEQINGNIYSIKKDVTQLYNMFFDEMCEITNTINAMSRDMQQLSTTELIDRDNKFKVNAIIKAIISIVSESTFYSGLFILLFMLFNKMLLGLTSISLPIIGIAVLVLIDRCCCTSIKTSKTISNHYSQKRKKLNQELTDNINRLELEREIKRDNIQQIQTIANKVDEIIAQLNNPNNTDQPIDLPRVDIERILSDGYGKPYKLLPINIH